MDEYINKTKFEELMRKKARNNFDLYYADKSKRYHAKAIGCDIAADEAHVFPAADVQPVIHAEWILFDKDCCGRAFYCSNCRKVTTTDDFENTPLDREEYFCPRCGADMRNNKI